MGKTLSFKVLKIRVLDSTSVLRLWIWANSEKPPLRLTSVQFHWINTHTTL
jgi:hypothetical protein